MTDLTCTTPRLNRLLGAYELGLISEEDRITIENHILECDACFEDLYQTSLIGKAVRCDSDGRDTRRRRWFVPAISAATLVLGFSTILYFMAEGPEIKRNVNLNEYAITLAQPQGTVEVERGVVQFTWESSEKALIYHLMVFDEEGNQVWSGTTAEQMKTLDLAETGSFEGRKTYFWKVEGTDKNGRILSTSRVSSFSIQAE